MSPRNPSELQRIHEETLSDERVHILQVLHGARLVPFTKSAKENMLRRLRVIEQELGLVSQNYNSSEFSR